MCLKKAWKEVRDPKNRKAYRGRIPMSNNNTWHISINLTVARDRRLYPEYRCKASDTIDEAFLSGRRATA